jgi:pre-mRNA-splicing helicase BRR2
MLQEIDAYWLQRRIGRAYGDTIDAPRAQQLAEEVLTTLASPTDSRAVENELVLALGFEQFELIKELLRNRLKVVWCTWLSRTQVHVYYHVMCCHMCVVTHKGACEGSGSQH